MKLKISFRTPFLLNILGVGSFYGVVPNIWNMIFSQYVIKFIFALCDTPIFYLLTGKSKTKKEIEFEKNVLTI